MSFFPSSLDVFSICICASYFIIFAPYQKRNHFLVRLLSGLVIGETALYFLTKITNIDNAFLYYIVNFGMVYLVWAWVVLFCYHISIKQLVFGCGAALALEQFCGALREICFISGFSFGLENSTLIFFIKTLIIYVPLYVPFAICYIRYKINLNEEAIKTKLSSVVALIVVFFCLIINRFVKWNFEEVPWYWSLGRSLYALVCSLLTLFIYYGFSLFNKMKKENTIIEANRKTAEEHYHEWKQFYENVNVALHDIRHSLDDTKESNEFAKKMLEKIPSYEHRIASGNETMDVLLYEKGNICLKNKINFTHMVDGKVLSAMDELDIYSLFSNLLDNSINAVKNLPEEKRTIALVVKCFGQGISIHVANFFDSSLPKETSPLHGYGLKSISYVVQKYHGNLNSTVDNEHYETDIMILPN